MNIPTQLNDNTVLTGVIFLLLGVLVYLFFFRKEEPKKEMEVEEVEEVEEDPYTVSVGNPKLITRCKPIPPVEKVEKIDFGFRPAYIPNSRGNVCEKGKVDDNILFPSLSNETVLENVTDEGETVVPFASFTGDEGLFSPNCSYSHPDCNNQQTTLFPGELLIKESVPVGTKELVSNDTVENFTNYYENFIEHQEDSSSDTEKTAKVTFYGAHWCGHCKNVKPHWQQFVNEYNGKVINGYKLNCKYEECGNDDNPACEKADVKSFPTFKVDRGDAEGEEEVNISDRSKGGILDAIKSLLD